jgi:hypothetical protein
VIMATYRKLVNCFGTDATIVIHDNGELEIDGYDIDYELALDAMGGGERAESICRLVAEAWANDKISAIARLVADDIGVCISLTADVLQHAAETFDAIYHSSWDGQQIRQIISDARKIADPRSSYDISDMVDWLFASEESMFDQSSRWRRGGAGRIMELQAMSEMFRAAAFVSRALRRATKAHHGHVDHGGVRDAADMAISAACWAIAFAKSASKTGHNRRTHVLEYYRDAANWVAERFVLGMVEFEKTGAWPELAS